jgi:hypothetical protein
MSELAFDVEGEPIDVPRDAVAWAVRRVAIRGRPQRMYTGQGLPLFLPITAGIEELRRTVQAEGRYFLDPVDEHQRRIAVAKTAYVWLRPQPVEGNLAPAVPTAPPGAVAQGTAEELAALAQACLALAQQITAAVPVLLGMADALVRTSQDADHALQAIRDLMR